MKCKNLPLLWRKLFLNISNNRDFIINYCIRPFNNFHKHCREWYLSQKSDDNEMLDDNLKNMFDAIQKFVNL